MHTLRHMKCNRSKWALSSASSSLGSVAHMPFLEVSSSRYSPLASWPAEALPKALAQAQPVEAISQKRALERTGSASI
jgi:hypothetical protein